LQYFRYTVLILIVLLLPALLIPGCSGSKEAEKKPSSEKEKAELPGGLNSIRMEMDKLIAELEQKAQVGPEVCGEEAEPTDGDGQDQQAQSSSGGEEKTAESAENKQESQNNEDSWSKIASGVKKTHQSWNEVEAEAVKEGLDTETRDLFEQALEVLTIKIEQKNIENSLFAVLEVYRYYPDMVDLFDSRVPAELFRLRYEVLSIRAEAARAGWDKAKEHLPELQTWWDVLKKMEAVKDEDIIQITGTSADDVKIAVEKEEKCLVQIKSEIFISNLDKIEKKFQNAM